jgi:hypothetical protein
LFDAIQHYEKLSGENSTYFKVYLAWMMAMNIGTLNVPPELKKEILPDTASALSMGRQAFFKQVFSALSTFKNK